MRRIQQTWFLLAIAVICSLAATSPDAPTSTPGTDLVPGVEPLEPTKEKETDIKSAIDGKKKLTIELKSKHQKKSENATTETAPTVPLLVRGEPVVKAEEEEVSSRGRALNMSAPEPTNSLHANLTDLSDVSMDDEDKEVEGGEYVAVHNQTEVKLPALTKYCTEGNKTFAIGEKVERGCDEKCVCGKDGKVGDCEPVCALPFVRAGKSANDPLCHERLSPTEPCCAVLVCALDSEPEPDETCLFENTTLTRGQRVEDKCERICVCEARGHLKCEPRCPPNDTTSKTNQSDRCVVLKDPTDKCCTITLCDVTLGDHEIKADNPSELSINITDVKVLNSTAIKIKLSTKSLQDVSVEISENNHDWRQVKPTEDGIISDLEPAHSYYVRILENGRPGPAFHVSLFGEVIKTNITDKMDKKCHHRGKTYDVGSQWYDECISICVCDENGKTSCATIECPTDFGLDVLDPHCIDWETVPPNHVPKAPNCCPEEIRCKNNGSCLYEGQMYENWSELPSNVTGCEKRCYCDMGNVSCQAACPPVPAEPPSSLHCPPRQAKLAKLPNDDCCQKWVCDLTSTPGKNDTREATKPSQDHFGHGAKDPMVPYLGPYNPEYKPTAPNVEQIFHIPAHSEKTAPPLKDKSKSDKSKSDSKKHLDTYKPTKEVIEQKFPGPLAPDRFDEAKPFKPHVDQPIFVPHDQQPPAFDFVPSSGENIPPNRFDSQFDNSAAGPPYKGPVISKHEDPNVIIPSAPKKKVVNDNYHDDGKKGKPGQKVTNQELPDDLYHLINLQHPGLVNLQHGPPNGHQGLYNLHQQVVQKGTPVNQIPPGYYDPAGAPKKPLKPQIFTQKNENGETTYHVHTSEIPSSPHQIEELIAHIAQHDSNSGVPFQAYPGQPISHVPGTPQTGLAHINHPFVGKPNQSGMEPNLPPSFHLSPSTYPSASPQMPDEVTVQELEPLSEHSVRLVFSVPNLYVGLHGRVELRYTSDKANSDPSTWKSQIFAPKDGLIATQQLEFELDGLQPATEYRVKITVKLKDLNNSLASKIYSIKTLDKQASIASLPPQIPVDAELRVMETNSTWVNVMWKKLTENELQFIDGVQLRYKEFDGKVYAATPLIHRSVTSYVLENLKPSTIYEIGIYFIPFPGQTTELISEKTIQVKTSTEPDPYAFDVKVEIKAIKSSEVEVSWSGVPYPEDKYVNIYRAIYQNDNGKEDTSTFKIAKRDSPAKTTINDLKPGTRYRLWIEVYLTNGRIKKSNVQDFVTKPGVVLSAGASTQGKLASVPLHEGDYYGPLVIVAIVASLSILSTLILLMMLMKRRTSSKADISPRKTTSAYDNPSYKTCDETVTISNGRSKLPDHEMATLNANHETKNSA